jgi:uncharacterized membrane protein YfcA
MGATNVPGLIVLGLVAGTLGGMFGIGGGLIMVPGLILVIGLGQKEATGTSLFAQLLPVGLLGVKEFWQRGEVNLGAGLSMAAGLFVGAWLGGMYVGFIPPQRMKQAYGAFLLCVGLYFLLAPSGVTRKPPAAPPAKPAATALAPETEG